MDRGAWWATVPGVAKSQTRQSDLHFHFFLYTIYCDRANILNPIGRKWGVNTCISLPLRYGIDKTFSSTCRCLPFTDSSSLPLSLQGPQHCVNTPLCSILPLLPWAMPRLRHPGKAFETSRSWVAVHLPRCLLGKWCENPHLFQAASPCSGRNQASYFMQR